MMNKLVTAIVAGFMLFSTGCMSRLTGDSYERGDTRSAYEVEYATIVGVRPVQIEGTKTGIGTVAGGAAGATGTENRRGRIAGAVLGAVLGSAIEKTVTKKQGVELTVRSKSGKTLAVVQEANSKNQFRVGQRVRLLRRGGELRVTP